jgi:hypothetical protein
MTQTASSKDHFFSKSTEDEKHSEGEFKHEKRLRTKRPLIVCQREDAQNEKLYKINGVIDDCGGSKSDENLI